MHNHYEAVGVVAALGVLLFWLGWLSKYGWDTRQGGARDQAAGRGWDAGRESGYREHLMTEYEPEPDDQGDDWSGTLASIPSVPAHEPEAAPEHIALPRTGTFIREQQFIYRGDPEVAAAELGARVAAWEVTGEGLAELPAVLADAHSALAAAAMACPRCGRSRWQTLIKGRKWRCRNCGLTKEDAPDDDDQAGNAGDAHAERPRGAAGRGADHGRIGDPGDDHGTGLAGGADPVGWLLADWDASAGERFVTIADQRAAAEFAVWETELGGLITSGYELLGEPVPPRGQVRRQLEVHHG